MAAFLLLNGAEIDATIDEQEQIILSPAVGLREVGRTASFSCSSNCRALHPLGDKALRCK